MDITTEEKPEECSSCGYETGSLTYYEPRPGGVEGKWLCSLCASTLTSNALDYPQHFTDGGATLKTICYVGNAILDALRNKV